MKSIFLPSEIILDTLQFLNYKDLQKYRLVHSRYNNCYVFHRAVLACPKMGSLCLCIEDPVVRPNYIVGNLKKPKEFTYEITQPCIDYCQNIWADQPNIYKRLIGKNILGRISGYRKAKLSMFIHNENVLNRRYKDQDFYDTCALLRLKCNNTLNKETIPVVLHFFVHCRDLFFEYVQFTSFFIDLWKISRPKNYLGGGRDFIRCQRFDFSDLSDWPYYGVMTRKEISNFFIFLQKHVRCRHMHWKSLMMSNVERKASRLLPLNKQKHLLFQRQLIDFLMSGAKACNVFYMHCRNFIYKPMDFFYQFVESYLDLADVSLIIPTIFFYGCAFADKIVIDQKFLQYYFKTITELDGEEVINKYCYKFNNLSSTSCMELQFIENMVEVYITCLL